MSGATFASTEICRKQRTGIEVEIAVFFLASTLWASVSGFSGGHLQKPPRHRPRNVHSSLQVMQRQEPGPFRILRRPSVSCMSRVIIGHRHYQHNQHHKPNGFFSSSRTKSMIACARRSFVANQNSIPMIDFSLRTKLPVRHSHQLLNNIDHSHRLLNNINARAHARRQDRMERGTRQITRQNMLEQGYKNEDELIKALQSEDDILSIELEMAEGNWNRVTLFSFSENTRSRVFSFIS